MPECPMCKKAHPATCGWRLYGSQNECPICLENKPEMMALPCGHQFCAQDLERLGIRQMASTRPVQSQPVAQIQSAQGQQNVRHSHSWAGAMAAAARVSFSQRQVSPLAHIMRHVRRRRNSQSRTNSQSSTNSQSRTRSTRRGIRRRCGWCGHIGHTQRKCNAHRSQCRCSTYKGARHKRLHATKNKCVVCFKKGHHFRSCSRVVKGFK